MHVGQPLKKRLVASLVWAALTSTANGQPEKAQKLECPLQPGLKEAGLMTVVDAVSVNVGGWQANIQTRFLDMRIVPFDAHVWNLECWYEARLAGAGDPKDMKPLVFEVPIPNKCSFLADGKVSEVGEYTADEKRGIIGYRWCRPKDRSVLLDRIPCAAICQ